MGNKGIGRMEWIVLYVVLIGPGEVLTTSVEVESLEACEEQVEQIRPTFNNSPDAFPVWTVGCEQAFGV